MSRDPRFVEHARWTAQKVDARSQASRDLDTLAERDAAVAAAAVLVQLDDPDWIPFAAAAFPTLPKVILDDLECFLLGQIELRPASWQLIGLALARVACGGAPSSSRLQDVARRLERSPPWVYDVFYDACVNEVRALNDLRQEAWLKELERPVVVVDAPPAPAGARVTVRRTPREWKLQDVFDLWSDAPMAIEVMSSHAPTELLRALDFERWFRAVDGWDDGRLVGGALFGDHLLQDRCALLRTLQLAAEVFDADGRWTGRTAAIVLTNLILRHAQMLHEELRRAGHPLEPDAQAPKALRELRELELPAYFAEAWSVLLGRRDGLPIAAALHADLCGIGLEPVRDGGIRAIARTALTRQLVIGRVRTTELSDLWAARSRVRTEAGLGARAAHASGVNVLMSALELVEASGPKDDALLGFFVDRIREPDPDWATLARGESFNLILDRVLKAVGTSENVLMTLCTLYEQLEPARRRAEYGRTYAENDGDLSSVLCLTIILGVLDEPAMPAALRNEALERALRWATRMLLTAAPAFEPTRSVERIFAFALRLAARFSSPHIDGALRVTVTDPSLSAWVTASLADELPRDRVDDLLRPVGLSVESVVERAREWAQVTDRPADAAAVKELEKRTRSCVPFESGAPPKDPSPRLS